MDAMREGSSDGPVLMPESMLHACVLGDADAALLAHGSLLRVEAGVRWVIAGNVAAYLAERFELARDAACRLMLSARAESSGDTLALPVQPSGLQQEAQYVWPIPAERFLPCEAIARDDSGGIALWSGAPVTADLLAKLVSMTGLPADRFTLHSLDDPTDPLIATHAALAAVALMTETGRAVCVDGYMAVSPGKEATVFVAASLYDDGALLDWRYVARTPGFTTGEAVTQDPSPYSSSRSTSLIDDAAALIPGSAHTFARESFVDEIACENHRDPVSFRLDHLDPVEYGGARELIGTVAERAAWDSHKQVRKTRRAHEDVAHGRGFAFDKHDTSSGDNPTPGSSARLADLVVTPLTRHVPPHQPKPAQPNAPPTHA